MHRFIVLAGPANPGLAEAIAGDLGVSLASRRVERAAAFATRIGLPVAVLTKRRPSGSEVETGRVIGEVHDRPCLLMDDMIPTGATIARGAEALRRSGARPGFRVVGTLGVFTDGAPRRVADAGVKDVVATDTIPPLGEEQPRVRRVSMAPLLATAVRRLADGESLRGLF